MLCKLWKLLLGLIIFSLSYLCHGEQVSKNILYEIRKEEAVVGYLLGIMHALPAGRKVFLSNSTINILSYSDGVITELGIAQFINQPEVIIGALNKIRQERKLSTLISKNLMSKIISELNPHFGKDTQEIINNAHPIDVMYSLLQEKCSKPIDRVQLETELALLASKMRKSFFSLETIENQINALPPLDSVIWSKNLENILNFIQSGNCKEKYHQILNKMSDAFSSGDVSLIKNELEKSYEILDFKQFDEISIYGRNNKLFSEIIKFIESGKIYIFATGVLHLAGPTGLISSFEKNGYFIKRIE